MQTPRVILSRSGPAGQWSGAFGNGTILRCEDDPIATLEALDEASSKTRFAGYISYDVGRAFESLSTIARKDLTIPLCAFASRKELMPHGNGEGASDARCIGSTFSRSDYESAVRRCIDYITAGDVFQVNLSQRLSIETNEDPWMIYRQLQSMFPAQFGAFLDFGDFQLLSNSPELFLRVTRLSDNRRKIINRPIKGTRPNAPGMRDALRDSVKDKAELAMIVDLQRNDLGRICEIGSVVVTDPRAIETHPTVLHGVATIEGILRSGVSLVDILRATFPCGSVTGCPKIRAMEIIEELEPVRRGAYCGAIGWIENGEMEFSVAIRTITMQNGIAYVPVGGGIVADSDPAEEYAETLVKAQAMLFALGVAQGYI